MLNYYLKGVTFIYSTLQATTSNNSDEVSKLSENGLFSILLVLALMITILVLINYSKISKRVSRVKSILKSIFLRSISDDDALKELIEISGYEYDLKQDIFYSAMNAWQRDVGYCRLYDEAAAPWGMIIDCEPIYFEYKGKRWMIEFWKGQYDLTTGCEVGVYTTEGPDLNIPGVFNGTFYYCASNEDRLRISYSLKKNNKILFTRKGKHWWLTGFILGEFSNPSDLSMDIKITLKDKTMRNAFVRGLMEANYHKNEIILNGNTVSLRFSKPRVPQPYTRTPKTDSFIQWKNKLLCDKYQYITRDYENTPDKINAVREKAPELYKIIVNIGKTKKIFEIYKAIEKYLDD